MKYQPEQPVILLDTEFKPATNAVIKEVNKDTQRYLIEYIFPAGAKPEQIWVPQERLSTAVDMLPGTDRI